MTRIPRIVRFGILFLLVLISLASCGGNDTEGNARATATPTCQPTYVYDQVQNQGEALDVVDFESAYNGTANKEIFTLSASHSASVSISTSDTKIEKFRAEVQAGIEASADAPLFNGAANLEVTAEAQADAIYESVHRVSNTVSKIQTSTTGSLIQLTIPPMSRGYGLYGAMVKITSGHLYSNNCGTPDDQGTISAIIPERFEWCTWTRGPNLFSDGGQGPCDVVAYNLG
ncbi:hypothetical protein [Dictyobacter aurantiacus]|uniref:Spondin domain-containing protein n=1 Tax=Dictyobacter aurantiacus TaxID=1936993 RepID=A0A401ZRJ5_9CHLR|nr:hypothetical protein [Dictyobacter aurantiacus]GCE09538.1 hypothetical protein KDAU_68670 [Dictyobacter aurantiacus]